MEPFRFKQFSVQHHRSAIKVGTDAVMLGAWADVTEATRILDIGTGCGVLALIAAQRSPTAQVHGVEIDDASAEEAVENAATSPWPDRIRIHRMDVRKLRTAEHFDHIISNPPFYAGEEPSPDVRKSVAKHGAGLKLGELIGCIADLLNDDGKASLIVPTNRSKELVGIAASADLALRRRTAVRYVAQRPSKRALLEFRREAGPVVEGELVVEHTGTKDFTPEYRALVSDLMLNF